MNQDERRKYLIQALLQEQPQYRNISIPKSENEQKTLDELKAEANDEDEAAAFEAGFSAWEDAKEE
jgi:hypothetical protein